MISFPKAKINLGLRVISKRTDGYHDIETIFYPIGLSDALEFIVAGTHADHDELSVTGLNIPGHDNIVLKAIKAIREHHNIPFLKVHLYKAIPCGSGLGGGSSDAASIIMIINKFFGIGFTDEKLKEIALSIGSDCPFFINPVPSLACGRGDKLTPIEPVLKNMHIVLLNPKVSISTKDAYLNCYPHEHDNTLAEVIGLKPIEWRKYVFNDFENYAFKIYPLIGELKTTLYNSGALYSSLTGSGSSIYGIFGYKPSLPQSLSKYVIYEGTL